MFTQKMSVALAVAIAVGACGATARADALEGGILTLLHENDAFADKDRDYTGGTKLSYVVPRASRDTLTRWASGMWPEHEALMRTELAVGQSLFTPSNTASVAPLPFDRPYAAWLYGSLGLIAEHKTHATTAELEIGVVGPSAGGEWAQTHVHNWLQNNNPKGWNNQVKNRFGVDFTVQRTWRAIAPIALLGLQADAEPVLGATLGNILTEAFAGATLRLGSDLERTALPMRVRPSLAGSGTYDRTTGSGWYVFAGATARAVGYNVFLEGPTPYVSHIDREPWVYDAQAGIAVRFGRLQTTYTYVVRTKEFRQQIGSDRFGAISFSWHF
jgi:hypothetical protein